MKSENTKANEFSAKIEDLQDKFRTQRAEFLKEMGYNEAIKLVEGNNRMCFITDREVRTIDTKYGEKYVFALGAENEGKDLLCSGMLCQMIVNELMNCKGMNKVYLTIQRIQLQGKTYFKVMPFNANEQ
jgi:hypothetical protein